MFSWGTDSILKDFIEREHLIIEWEGRRNRLDTRRAHKEGLSLIYDLCYSQSTVSEMLFSKATSLNTDFLVP